MPASETRPLILYCGGTGFTRSRFGEAVVRALLPYGDVVVWDYPGRGDSSGRMDLMSGPLTAEAVVDDLAAWVEREASTGKRADRPVLVWGHSRGGFVGAQLATRTDAVDALVLETTAPDPLGALESFGTVPPMVRRFAPLLDRYNIPRTLERFDGDTLVFGAGRDRVLPVRLSRELAGEIDGATYIEIADATHFDTLARPETGRALRTLLTGLGVETRP